MVQAMTTSMFLLAHAEAGYPRTIYLVETNLYQIGISVANTPIAVNNATADIAMFLIIGALRRITAPFLSVRAGSYPIERHSPN
jgi:glyoxylate reductase